MHIHLVDAIVKGILLGLFMAFARVGVPTNTLAEINPITFRHVQNIQLTPHAQQTYDFLYICNK